MTFGIADQLLTDQGRDFQAMLIAELADLLDVHRLRTTPYHPQTDGITERFNRTLKVMLTNYLSSKQDDWDVYLEQLAFAFNTAVHATHGHTPFELMFGREPKLPLDLFYEALDERDELTDDERQRTQIHQALCVSSTTIQQQFMKEAFAKATELRERRMEKAKIRYDREASTTKYNVGDLVLLHEDKQEVKKSRKLSFKWTGPYEFLAVVNDVNYKLKKLFVDLKPSGKPRKTRTVMAHFNRLKKYRGSATRTQASQRTTDSTTVNTSQEENLATSTQVDTSIRFISQEILN